MFRTATIRDPNCYVRWPESNTPDKGLEEHSTQFYPNWELTSYLKKYVVSNVRDPDFCNKAYETAETFSFGFLSVGCCCQLNQTLGFELLLNKESPKNLFRLLMCRDLEFSRLRGIIFDHACGLNQYIMNREPQRFQYLRTLVDGVHFCGHKRQRKGQARKVGIQDAPMDSTPWSTRNIGSPATTPKGRNKYTVRLMLSHLPSAKCPTKATWSCLEPSLLSII